MQNEKRAYLILEMFYQTGNEIVFSAFNRTNQVSSRYTNCYYRNGFCQRQILFDGGKVYRYEVVEDLDTKINHVAHQSCIRYKDYDHIKPIMEKELIARYGITKYERYLNLIDRACSETYGSFTTEFYSFSIPPIAEYDDTLEDIEVIF